MMRALQNFVAEPLRHRRFDLAWYRMSQLLHDRTNGGFDAVYMNLAKKLRPKVPLPASSQMSGTEIAAVVEQLRREGYMILPLGLSIEEIEQISNFAFSTPAIGSDLGKAIPISRDDIPEGEPRYYWWMDHLAAVPAVQRIVVNGPYCAIAQEYLGCRPVLAHITLFLDRPFKGNYEAYSYHYDNEGPAFLKFFFFLTDVTIGTGAHYFMMGTQAHTKPRPFAKARIYAEEDIHGHYGREKEIIVRGPAGTILAEDTSGFHRGSTIDHSYRLLMQIEFSVIDVPTEQELNRKLNRIVVHGMHPGIGAITHKFFVADREPL
jgi:hypothetical protein